MIRVIESKTLKNKSKSSIFDPVSAGIMAAGTLGAGYMGMQGSLAASKMQAEQMNHANQLMREQMGLAQKAYEQGQAAKQAAQSEMEAGFDLSQYGDYYGQKAKKKTGMTPAGTGGAISNAASTGDNSQGVA